MVGWRSFIGLDEAAGGLLTAGGWGVGVVVGAVAVALVTPKLARLARSGITKTGALPGRAGPWMRELYAEVRAEYRSQLAT